MKKRTEGLADAADALAAIRHFVFETQELSVNAVSAQQLLDAKKDPEAHRDLVVRVGGFSAYFCQLNEGLQDNIIARTLH